MNNPSERFAPHSVEAEEAVLGSILLNPDVFPDLKNILTADSFYILRNSYVWEAVENLLENQMDVDNISLIEVLKQTPDAANGNRLNAIGGGAYLSHLINNTETSFNATTYARIVAKAERRRRLMNVASQIATFSTDPTIDDEEAISKSQAAFNETLDRVTDGKTADFIVSGADSLLDVIDGLGTTKTDIAYRMPFPAIWEFGGFCEFITAGKVVLLQGVSGGYKTTISECMSDLLLMDGYNVMQWGGEWNPRENALRRLQRAGGIRYVDYMRSQVARNLHQRGVDTTEWGVAEIGDVAIQDSAELAVHLIANTPGHIDYINARYSHFTLDDILARTGRYLEKQRERGVIYHSFIWDYAQMVNNPVNGNQIENAVGKLKAFCGEWQMFGIITSQVNKNATRDNRGGAGLTESDGQFLRADKNNLVVSASPVYVETTKFPYIRIDVNKNSTGRTGEIYLSNRGSENLKINIIQKVSSVQVQLEIDREKKRLKALKKAMRGEEEFEL